MRLADGPAIEFKACAAWCISLAPIGPTVLEFGHAAPPNPHDFAGALPARKEPGLDVVRGRVP